MLIFEAVVYETPPQQAEILLDESLFPRIASGDKAAFLALYEKCSSPVFAYALSILRSHSDSEDAMQDTFLKIRSAAHLYQPLGKPLAWILTITRNICLMMYRQRAHTAQLPEDSCRIIMLHALSGMKHREIAELMNMPLSTVLSKYKRGIEKLRSELEGML